MSNTIEIISRHTGRMSVKVKGESKTVQFEKRERDGKTVGIAQVDHDTAAVLLGTPALAADFWKVGGEIAVGTPDQGKAGDDQAEQEKAPPAATGEAEKGKDSDSDAPEKKADPPQDVDLAGIVNFNGFKAAVKKCNDAEKIKSAIAAEIAKEEPNDKRLGVLNERITELQ